MRIAIIENQEVVNVIVGDELPENGIECPETVCVGWTYVNEEFIAPPIVYADDEAETI
jgi:hypothetical protein